MCVRARVRVCAWVYVCARTCGVGCMRPFVRAYCLCFHVQELCGLTKLKELDISKNALVSLPQPEFCQLSALTDLYLSENCLTELPEDIGKANFGVCHHTTSGTQSRPAWTTVVEVVFGRIGCA